jgi:hypothetical protein
LISIFKIYEKREKPAKKAGEGQVGRPPKEKRAATVNNVLSQFTVKDC